MNPAKHIAFTCAVLSTAAVPALASAAPSVSADKPCYVPGQAQRITGSGYKPGGEVSLSYNQSGPHGSNAMGATVSADGAGNINELLKTPDLASSDDNQETVNLGASDNEPPQNGTPPALGTTQFLASTFDAIVPAWDAHEMNPRKKTTFYAYGFEVVGGKTFYAHYVLRGKLRKTVAIGHLTGPCGDLKKKQRQFPFRPVKAGTYKVKLDATKKYPNKSPGYTYKRVKVSKKRAVR